MGGNGDLKQKMADLRKQEHVARQKQLREQRRSDRSREAQRRKPLLERYQHTNWYRATKWTLSSLGGLAAIIASIYTFAGPIWPTDPEIHPRDALDGSSFILPFTVKNKSVVFPMPNVEFTCGIDWVYLQDAGGMRGVFGQQAFVNGTYSIKRGETINYQCDASQLIKINPNGSLSIRSMSLGMPQALVAPLKIREMCVWVRAEYKIAGFIPRTFTSAIYQWPAGTHNNQWLEGPTVRDGVPTTDAYWPVRGALPTDIVTCAPTPHPIALLFDKAGNPSLDAHSSPDRPK
jgi:hypothetical protein